MFSISLSEEALVELRDFRKRDSTLVFDEIERQLTYQPDVETKNRKSLRGHPLGEWELRVERFRVFYDVDQSGGKVLVKAIGTKVGNRLFIAGKEYLI